MTEADFEKWTAADLKPYIDHVIECFGFDRVIYGSDWPVAAQATNIRDGLTPWSGRLAVVRMMN